MAEAQRIATEAEVCSLREEDQAAAVFPRRTALLHLTELETLSALARSANARIRIGFDKHAQFPPKDDDPSQTDACA
jgi:hypothetical protein